MNSTSVQPFVAARAAVGSDGSMHPLTTIRTDDPRELLALVPYQLGFQPTESAVAVSLRGQRSRVGLVARVDLEDLAHRTRGQQVARSLVSHLVADGASALALVIYTAGTVAGPAPEDGSTRADGSVRGHGPGPERARDNLAAAAEHFLDLVTCWVVGPRGYVHLDCQDLECCPPDGRPLTALQGTQVSAQMVLSGACVAGSRAALAYVEPASAAARRSARRSSVRWAARLPAADGSGTTGGAEDHRWRRDGLALWRTELDRAGAAVASVATGSGAGSGPCPVSGPEPTVVGRLEASLADVLVRDAVLLTLLPGAQRVADRVVAGHGGDDVGAALRALVDTEHGVPPDPVVSQGAQSLLRQVIAHSARRSQAPASSLLAVLAWWDGDGARAAVHAEVAVAVEPGYRLALLVLDALAAGMPPGWLRRARSA